MASVQAVALGTTVGHQRPQIQADRLGCLLRQDRVRLLQHWPCLSDKGLSDMSDSDLGWPFPVREPAPTNGPRHLDAPRAKDYLPPSSGPFTRARAPRLN